ncbi:hypothetical protein C8R46DRAFT_1033509 [Mycena filopes]|nr:hypothetical protein C8R46DRAFT_1033509 [Mycena filopes]
MTSSDMEESPVKKFPRTDSASDAASNPDHGAHSERQSPASGRKGGLGPRASSSQSNSEDPFLTTQEDENDQTLRYGSIGDPNNRYSAIREQRNRDRSVSPTGSRGSSAALNTGRPPTALSELEDEVHNENEVNEPQAEPEREEANNAPGEAPEVENDVIMVEDDDSQDEADGGEYPGVQEEDDVAMADAPAPAANAELLAFQLAHIPGHVQPAAQQGQFVFGQQGAGNAFNPQIPQQAQGPDAAPPAYVQPPAPQAQAPHAAPPQQQPQQPFIPLAPQAPAPPGGAEAALTAPRWVLYPNPAPGPNDALGAPTGEAARDETPTCRMENPHKNVPAEPAGVNVHPADADYIPRQLMEGQMPAQVVATHKLIKNANPRMLAQVLKDPHNHLLFVTDNGGRVYRERIGDAVDLIENSISRMASKDEIEVFDLGVDDPTYGITAGRNEATTYAGCVAYAGKIISQAAADRLVAVEAVVCNDELAYTIRRADHAPIPWVLGMHKPNREPKTLEAQDSVCRDIRAALTEDMTPTLRLAIDHAFPASDTRPSAARVDEVIRTIDTRWDPLMKYVVSYMRPCTTDAVVWERVVDALCGLELVWGRIIFEPILKPNTASGEPRCLLCKNECHFGYACPRRRSGITWWGAKDQIKNVTTGRLAPRATRGGGNANRGGGNRGGNRDGPRGRGRGN